LECREGNYFWDVNGERYLDFAGEIAGSALGSANPEIAEARNAQSRKLIHVSNLYCHELQGRFAKRIADLIGAGRCFLQQRRGSERRSYKPARTLGHEYERCEIITTFDSFHGRSLAGIAATGHHKVKMFWARGRKTLAFAWQRDLEAMRTSITRSTIATLIEAIQGESGVVAAAPIIFSDFGNFATRTNCSSCVEFAPDGVSIAKSFGGGFPIAAFWARENMRPQPKRLSRKLNPNTVEANPVH